MVTNLKALTLNPRWEWPSFWIWWREGLLAWLPLATRRWLAGSSRRLVVALDGGEWALARDEAGQIQELERLDRTAPDWSAAAKWFKTEKPQQLVVRFPADQALIRGLSLPLAAEKNPRQVAGFEMDRLTPFTAAQVYYDTTVLERQLDQRRLRVELTALPQAGVEPVLAALRQQGLQPDVVDVAGGRPGLNLLPVEQRVRRGLAQRRLWAVLVVCALLLVAAAAVLPIWQQRQLLIGVLAKADKLQPAANQALALRDQLERAIETSRMLLQKKQALPPKVDLLRELTAILPDDTWLERLQIKGDNLQIIGQSAKASALIGIVDTSKFMNSPGFASPVTIDPRFGKERFMLNARVGLEP
ncbi:MAG TPA: PilN domain-containing protein [Candidatus Competibacter sp.]|nr:twitching motility protein PilT [Candidatus Competibacteraceae bacterium]HRE53947.1 PilN domain-containing protein [Candidatus Competibacter sp.]HUM95169.1 PilN domain-containing protein [Candidatus Competibacter sp.]